MKLVRPIFFHSVSPFSLAIALCLSLVAIGCSDSGGSDPGSVPSCTPSCDDRCDGSDDGCGGSCDECASDSQCIAQQTCELCDAADACGEGCIDCTAGASNYWCVNGATCGCELDSDCAEGERCVGSSCQPCKAEDGCVRSELYPNDWFPGYTTAHGEFVHDFSYAGYHNSEADIPTDIPGVVVDVQSKGADASGQADSTAAIQAAIDEVAAAGGGVVLFSAGEYRVEGVLTVSSSGVVLRGASHDNTKVYFTLTGEALTDAAHVRFRGEAAVAAEALLTEDAATQTTRVKVADSSAFSPGDDVSLGWVMTNDFLVEHDMDIYWSHSLDKYKVFFRRQVVAVHPNNEIEIDVPLRYSALVRDSASLRKETGYLSEVGIENLTLSNAAPTREAAQAINKAKVVQFRYVKDAWARGLRTYSSPVAGGDCGRSGDTDRRCHVQSLGVEVYQSKRVTVRDVVIERAQNLGGGGNGYLFVLRMSDEVMVEDSVGSRGRHNFITDGDFSVSGSVYRNNLSFGGLCEATINVTCYDEFHRALAMAMLVENHDARDGWLAGNRRNESSGAGHTATESVFWRTYGGGIINSFQYGNGYVIGADNDVRSDPLNPLYWITSHTGIDTAPEDWVEHTGARDSVHPASLFDDQLARRLRAKSLAADAGE